MRALRLAILTMSWCCGAAWAEPSSLFAQAETDELPVSIAEMPTIGPYREDADFQLPDVPVGADVGSRSDPQQGANAPRSAATLVSAAGDDVPSSTGPGVDVGELPSQLFPSAPTEFWPATGIQRDSRVRGAAYCPPEPGAAADPRLRGGDFPGSLSPGEQNTNGATCPTETWDPQGAGGPPPNSPPAVFPGPPYDEWTQSYCWGGQDLTARVGAMYLYRSTPSSNVLIGNPAAPGETLNASNFRPGWAAGLEASFIMHDVLGDMNSLEARYFGVDGWTDQQTLQTTGPSTVVYTTPNNIDLGAHRTVATLASELHSFEVNGRHHLTNQRIVWLAGFRMLEFDERFDAAIYDAVTGAPIADVSSYVRNRLYGFQVGAESTLWGNERFCLGSFVKFAVFGNFSENQTNLTCYCVPPEISNASDNPRSTSFLTEFGLQGRYRLWRQLSLVGKYQAIWLGGIAVATDQFSASNFTTGNGISTSGDAWFHGATAGLELAY